MLINLKQILHTCIENKYLFYITLEYYEFILWEYLSLCVLIIVFAIFCWLYTWVANLLYLVRKIYK